MPAKVPLWLKIMSTGLTFGSCVLYLALYMVLSDYRQSVVGVSNEPSVFIRVILNIYQSYLGVFILISLALLVLFFIKARYASSNYKVVFILMALNTIFSAVLFSVSYIGVT